MVYDTVKLLLHVVVLGGRWYMTQLN